MTYRSKSLLLSICVLLQAACSNNAVYPEESFAYDSLFKLRTDGDVALACESARRSLLGEGYLIERANSEGVVGRKAYKSEGKENTFIEMNIVCAPDASGSTVYATGVLSTYTLKMSSSSASVGVSALGSISLPIGQSADSLVKVSEETINDKEFYRRFFAAVDVTLGDLMAGRAALEPVPAKVAPAPAPEATPAQAAAPKPKSKPKPKPKTKPAKEEPAPAETTAPKAPEPVATPVAPITAPESAAAAPAEPTPLSEQQPAAAMPKPTPAPTPSPTTPAAIVPEAAPGQEAPAKTAPEEIPAPPIEPVTTGT
jgi:Uncharacterized protein conserved in bacteria (DUF2242)